MRKKENFLQSGKFYKIKKRFIGEELENVEECVYFKENEYIKFLSKNFFDTQIQLIFLYKNKKFSSFMSNDVALMQKYLELAKNIPWRVVKETWKKKQ